MRLALVVEDDAHNATVFRKLLEKRLGFTVMHTADPHELFAALAEGNVGLIIMDVSLKGAEWDGHAINGVELCRLLKSDPANARIPVLLATAHAMSGDEERLLAESGADRYLSKPIVNHDVFVSCVRDLVKDAA